MNYVYLYEYNYIRSSYMNMSCVFLIVEMSKNIYRSTIFLKFFGWFKRFP